MVVPSPEGAQLISVSAQKMLALHIAHCIQDMVTYAFFLVSGRKQTKHEATKMET